MSWKCRGTINGSLVTAAAFLCIKKSQDRQNEFEVNMLFSVSIMLAHQCVLHHVILCFEQLVCICGSSFGPIFLTQPVSGHTVLTSCVSSAHWPLTKMMYTVYVQLDLTWVSRSSDRVLTWSQDPRSYRCTFVSTGTAKNWAQTHVVCTGEALMKWGCNHQHQAQRLMSLTFAVPGCQASRHRDFALLTSLVFCSRGQLISWD